MLKAGQKGSRVAQQDTHQQGHCRPFSARARRRGPKAHPYVYTRGRGSNLTAAEQKKRHALLFCFQNIIVFIIIAIIHNNKNTGVPERLKCNSQRVMFSHATAQTYGAGPVRTKTVRGWVPPLAPSSYANGQSHPLRRVYAIVESER